MSLVGYNLNTVIPLLPLMIIGLEHGLVHIFSGMTLESSYYGIKRPLSNFSGRKYTGISMCLTIGVTILASTTEIQLVLYYQCTVVLSVWSAKDSIYLRITFVFLTALYMHLIYPPVDSDSIAD